MLLACESTRAERRSISGPPICPNVSTEICTKSQGSLASAHRHRFAASRFSVAVQGVPDCSQRHGRAGVGHADFHDLHALGGGQQVIGSAVRLELRGSKPQQEGLQRGGHT
jgi:hypothetical protein